MTILWIYGLQITHVELLLCMVINGWKSKNSIRLEIASLACMHALEKEMTTHSSILA